jgi:ribosome-associated protein
MKKKIIDDAKILNLAGECGKLLINKKAKDVLLIDLKKVNSYLDFFIIATGNSFIHCRTLAKEVQRFFKITKFAERTKTRLDSGWIALDYSEIVVHIFVQELRDYYQLEKLWADADFIDF